MTSSVFTAFGGLRLPVSNQDVESSLSSLDPARDRMLAWFAAAINAEFSSAWTEATAALPGDHQLIGTSPVQDTMPLAPTPGNMGQRKSGFPLLALHRTGEATFEPLTIEDDQMTQEWHLHHILGPLDIEGERRILDIGQAIGKLLAVTVRHFGHPAYESGANQLEAGRIESLAVKDMAGPGPAQFDGDENDAIFWATRYTLETTEYTDDITGQMPPFAGLDMSLDVGGASEPDISPSFIEASTDPAYQDP